LDSLSGSDTTRFYYTKDASFQIAGYKSVTKDKMYSMKVDTIKGSTASKKIAVSGFKLTPLYDELTFARKYKIQKDRYDLNFEKIEFNGVDFLGLNTDQKLYAKSLKIGPAKVEVFMSRESPPPTSSTQHSGVTPAASSKLSETSGSATDWATSIWKRRKGKLFLCDIISST
jgi:hypothetical protein